MGNPDGLPGDLAACVDHVAEVKRTEAQLRLSRLRNQQEPTKKHDGLLSTKGYHPIYPDDPWHPDNPGDKDMAEVEMYEDMDGKFVLVEGGYGSFENRTIYLDAKQALSLLSWLEQEKATLEQLAIEQKEG